MRCEQVEHLDEGDPYLSVLVHHQCRNFYHYFIVSFILVGCSDSAILADPST
jgi:hypothetical protein